MRATTTASLSITGILLIFLVTNHTFAQQQTTVESNLTARCSKVVDCAEVAVRLAEKMQDSMIKAVPAGAVMAFNLKECPPGWNPFSLIDGKVIVGSGAGPGPDQMVFGASGGEQKHLQTVTEMPSHNHVNGRYTQLLQPGPHRTATSFDDTNGETDIVDSAPEVAVGGGQPFNVMQPYYVLTYCQRSD